MSKRKKGVSMEEKRERILHIYHDSKDVFNLKEVEKIGAKAGVGTFAYNFMTLDAVTLGVPMTLNAMRVVYPISAADDQGREPSARG